MVSYLPSVVLSALIIEAVVLGMMDAAEVRCHILDKFRIEGTIVRDEQGVSGVIVVAD